MHDRRQAQHELLVLSAETRLFAWVIGPLSIVVGGVIIMFNVAYIISMWCDSFGKTLVLIAFGMEVLGTAMLAKLAKSV